MCSDTIVIDVHGISKCYEIYETPRDRLKQLILPGVERIARRLGRKIGISQKSARRYYREYWALNDVSFQVRSGETLGIIGRNGSGKSTLLQILAGTLLSTRGDVSIHGRVAALLELGSGFNPEFSGKENVILNGLILGLTREEIESRYQKIVEFADIGDFIDQPVKTYSSGMFVRLAFAVQAHIDASIVIIDEALAVGDIFFRQKCYARLEELRNAGAAILLVSHSMPEVEQFCDTAILLDHGAVKFIGSAAEAAKHYYLLHQPLEEPRGVNKVALTSSQSGPSVTSFKDRPIEAAFLDLQGKAQVSSGDAQCVGVALCDERGNPCTIFRQGDIAVFYYEFEIFKDIEIPICGITISNERGIIVHGKNNLQQDGDIPRWIAAGSRVACRQEIKLDLSPAEYVFQVGLASFSAEDWEERKKSSYEKHSAQTIRICHVPNVASFVVGLGLREGVSYLSHHGIADLPGKMVVHAYETTAGQSLQTSKVEC